MAIIPCPACGGKVSEMTPDCPHCGHPIDSDEDDPAPKPARKIRGGVGAFLTKPLPLGLLFIVVAFVFVLLHKLAMNSKKAVSVGDDALSRQIVGSWAGTTDLEGRDGGSFTQTYFSNGTATTTGTVTIHKRKVDYNFKCNWRIEGKKIHEVVTESSLPKLIPVGRTYSEEIIERTDTELIIVPILTDPELIKLADTGQIAMPTSQVVEKRRISK